MSNGPNAQSGFQPQRPSQPIASSSSSGAVSRHDQVVSSNLNSGGRKAEGVSTSIETAATHSKTVNRHRRPTLDEVVESVFQSVTGEYGEAKGFDIPENFFDFYENPLFRHFLACIVYYYFGYVDLRKLEAQNNTPDMEDLDPAQTKPSRSNIGAKDEKSANRPGSNIRAREISYTQSELRRRLRLVGEAYSRLLLTCSNFEHTSEDKRFFEFVFEFTRSVTRLAIDKKYWDDMEESLSYLFRGYMFNNPALRSKNSRQHELHHHQSISDVEEGSDRGRQDGMDSNPSGNGVEDDGATDEQIVGLSNSDGDRRDEKAITDGKISSSSKKSGKSLEPIDLARRTLAKYRSRVTGAPRAREIRARRRLRSQRLQEAATNDVSTGLLPPEVASLSAIYRTRNQKSRGKKRLSVRHKVNSDDEVGIYAQRDITGLGTRRSMQSVREIINARSPLVSLLFPTPMERAAQNQLLERANKLSRRQKIVEERERLKKEQEEAEWKHAKSLLPRPNGPNEKHTVSKSDGKGSGQVRGATGATRKGSRTKTKVGPATYNGTKGGVRVKRGAALFEV